MTDLRNETGVKPKLKLIKGGQAPVRIIEVSSIGDYKEHHPSKRRQLTEDTAKITAFRRK